MNIFEIKKYRNPILRKKSEELKEITPEIKELVLAMTEIMEKNQGVGLAAPQVGELKRVIVVHPIKERSLEEKSEKRPQIFINPEIIKKTKGTEIDEEGCLSFPELFLKIKRAKEVEIEALNLNGEKIQIKAEGLPARIFQHEIDHLDGVLFIDRLSFWQRWKFRNQLKKLKQAYH